MTLNTTTISTYPAWQQAIRAAQAAVNTQLWVEAQRQAEAKAAQEANQRKQNAESLRQVLGLMGIEARPEDNEWLADGLRFHLQRKGAYHDGRYDTLSHWGGERVGFTLFITDVDYDGIQDNVNVSDKRQDADWTPERAKLANILDDLAEQRAKHLEWLAEQDAVESKDRTSDETVGDSFDEDDTRVFTTGQQLELLIRRMVSEEIESRWG